MDSSARPEPDLYETLGLSPDASSGDVEAAFHARVREHLQNSNVGDAPIRERARKVGLAYETLRDPAKRRAYDATRSGPEEPGPAAPPTAARKRERPIMFTPPAAPEPPAEEAARPQAPEPDVRPEPEVQPEPEPEVLAEPEPQARPSVAPAIAAAAAVPIAARAVEPEPAVAAAEREPAAEERIEPAEASATGSDLVAHEPPLPPATDEPSVAHWEDRRRTGVNRGAIAAVGVVIALGAGALLLTRTENHSGPTRAAPAAQVASNAAPPSAAPVATATNISPAVATAPPASAQQAGSAQTEPLIVAPSGKAVTLPLPPPTPGKPASSPANSNAPPTQAPAQWKPQPALASAAPPSGNAPAPLSPAAPSPQAAAPQVAAVAPPVPVPAPIPAVPRRPFPRWLGGAIMDSDNARGQFQGTVGVRFTVEPNGIVSNCRTTQSSGDPGLDARTCLLVEQRLRFSPALNSAGTPMASDVRTTYTWGRRIRR